MVQVWYKIDLIVELLPPSYERIVVHAAVGECRDHGVPIRAFVVRRSVDELVQEVKIVKGIYISAICMLDISGCPEIHTYEQFETSVFRVPK